MPKAVLLFSAILASFALGCSSGDDDVFFGECANDSDCEDGLVCSSEQTCMRPVYPSSGSAPPSASPPPSGDAPDSGAAPSPPSTGEEDGGGKPDDKGKGDDKDDEEDD